jgi:hypothetical protein
MEVGDVDDRQRLLGDHRRNRQLARDAVDAEDVEQVGPAVNLDVGADETPRQVRPSERAPPLHAQRRHAVVVARDRLEVARHERRRVQLGEAAALDEGDADLEAGAR